MRPLQSVDHTVIHEPDSPQNRGFLLKWGPVVKVLHVGGFEGIR